jgi:hypothetical protein
MRSVFKGGAVVALLAILVAPAVYAEGQSTNFDPPQARIAPPIGIAAQDEAPTLLDLLWSWLQARIAPPIG